MERYALYTVKMKNAWSLLSKYKSICIAIVNAKDHLCLRKLQASFGLPLVYLGFSPSEVSSILLS